MHENEELIRGLYAALGRRDGEAMARCYADGASFTDPVFVGLRGEEVRDMWRMLCERSTDLAVTLVSASADGSKGRARWEATYTFSGTGRTVHNVIDSELDFEGGRIVAQRDSFDLWRWAGMALGTKGKLLGFLPPVQGSIRAQARKTLETYSRRRAGA